MSWQNSISLAYKLNMTTEYTKCIAIEDLNVPKDNLPY